MAHNHATKILPYVVSNIMKFLPTIAGIKKKGKIAININVIKWKESNKIF